MSAIWKSYNISFVYEHKNSYSYERLKVNLKSLDPNAFDELCEVILLHKPNVKYPLIIFYIDSDQSQHFICNASNFDCFRKKGIPNIHVMMHSSKELFVGDSFTSLVLAPKSSGSKESASKKNGNNSDSDVMCAEQTSEEKLHLKLDHLFEKFNNLEEKLEGRINDLERKLDDLVGKFGNFDGKPDDLNLKNNFGKNGDNCSMKLQQTIPKHGIEARPTSFSQTEILSTSATKTNPQCGSMVCGSKKQSLTCVKERLSSQMQRLTESQPVRMRQQCSPIECLPIILPDPQEAASYERREPTRLTDEEVKILRAHYAINNSPSEESIMEISRKANLPKNVIKCWFRNTIFKEKMRSSHTSRCNFNNGPSTTLNLEERIPQQTNSIASRLVSIPMPRQWISNDTGAESTSDHKLCSDDSKKEDISDKTLHEDNPPNEKKENVTLDECKTDAPTNEWTLLNEEESPQQLIPLPSNAELTRQLVDTHESLKLQSNVAANVIKPIADEEANVETEQISSTSASLVEGIEDETDDFEHLDMGNDTVESTGAVSKELMTDTEPKPTSAMHPNPRVNKGIITMIGMGFKNEPDLIEVLELVDGDIDRALELIIY